MKGFRVAGISFFLIWEILSFIPVANWEAILLITYSSLAWLVALALKVNQ